MLSPKRRFLSAILGGPVDHVPPTCVTQVGIVEAMEATGATWPEAHTDPEKMAQLGASLYKLAGVETARIPFCLTVQAEVLGCKVDLGKIDKSPSIEEPPFTSASEIEMPEDFLSRGRVPAVLEATRILRKEYGDVLPIIAGIEGPFTLGGHLIGIEKFMIWCIKKPDEVREILDKTTEANIIYSKALLKSGADVICNCDPSASPELISPKMFEIFVKPKLTEIVESVGGIQVLHVCGKAGRIIKDMVETGFDALSIEEKVDVREAKEIVKGKTRLVGNVSAATTIFRGKPAEVKEEAKKALEAGIDLLTPGCGIAPRSPLANIKALVEATREFYR